MTVSSRRGAVAENAPHGVEPYPRLQLCQPPRRAGSRVRFGIDTEWQPYGDVVRRRPARTGTPGR
ncbi:hypothetical protein [Streptomyces canus]|uniref:hypothetical protein n=1 Tax=Streptomyces canus TaxID=58343 RepID=UPI0033B35F90